MYLLNNCQGKLIDREIWEEYEKIVEVFAGDLSFAYDISNQEKLWKYIINNRNKMLKKINKSIKIITGLCCEINEERQIKELNYPLFTFCHLYDHKFYDFSDSAFTGLNKFYKIWKSTFGNMKSFFSKYKKIRAIISFVEERRDIFLLKEYNYLNNISLPISGYETLRIDLITILKKFDQLAPIIGDRENYDEFCREIIDFKKIYIIEYRKRHLYYQNKINYLKRKVLTMPLYRVLCRLNDIEGIENDDTIEYIDSFFANRCNKDNINKILLKQPKCSCGFTIGENLTIPSLDKIKPMLCKAIKSRIKFLRKKLKKYYRENPQSPVKILYNLIDPLYLEEIELINIIDKELICEINYALGNRNLIKIDIEKILPEIEGTYTVDNISEVIAKFKEMILSKIRDYPGNNNGKNVIIKIEHKI